MDLMNDADLARLANARDTILPDLKTLRDKKTYLEEACEQAHKDLGAAGLAYNEEKKKSPIRIAAYNDEVARQQTYILNCSEDIRAYQNMSGRSNDREEKAGYRRSIGEEERNIKSYQANITRAMKELERGNREEERAKQKLDNARQRWGNLCWRVDSAKKAVAQKQAEYDAAIKAWEERLTQLQAQQK